MSQATCSDCGSEVSKPHVSRCLSCHRKHIAKPNTNRVCPSCGGEKSWEASSCRECRWGNYEYSSCCRSCGVPIQSKSRKCLNCYHTEQGYKPGTLARDHQCLWPGCLDLVGSKGGKGRCARHHQEMRRRHLILESDRRHKTALFYVGPHSFSDRPPCLFGGNHVFVARVRRKLLKKQGGVCALCATPDDGDFHLDHDNSCRHHDKRKFCACCVRGVLCRRCNNTLGHNADAEWLAKASEYISKQGR